ncbi:DNA cytosine methyltransferase [Enterococcus faecalis]|uniref:DNA cytosine methyltransferase n=1 Tax=Enterococcus faecalis TaxID=1351 RepID=UPI0040419589
MKFLDLFAGIGGFRLGMESAGHECIGFCEIDKFARTSYKAIHDTTGEVEMHDITTISDEFIRGIGSVDVICGGFPCQAFSIAGKRKGFEDTRGTLFFEIARFASILRPRYLFLENVKGLLNHEGGATFETILRALDELGYDVEWQVLNSKDYVPQNRERVFIIGHLRGERTRKVFPFKKNDRAFTKLQGQQIYANTLTTRIEAQGTGTYVIEREQHEEKIAIPVLTPDRVEKRQNGRRFKDDGEEMFTLTAQDKHGVAIIQKSRGYNDGGIYKVAPTVTSNSWHENNFLKDSIRIRKLTPRECWRLQGFPDWAFDKAKEVNSDSQLYKQAGNSVTVPVIADIASRLESE